MPRTSTWIRRLLVLAVVAGAMTAVSRALRPVDGRDGLIPAIGGDTWPPVPVKDARPG